jgi:hypothetical protein
MVPGTMVPVHKPEPIHVCKTLMMRSFGFGDEIAVPQTSHQKTRLSQSDSSPSLMKWHSKLPQFSRVTKSECKYRFFVLGIETLKFKQKKLH